jgi:ribokinase
MKYDIITIGSATQDVFLSSEAFRVTVDSSSPAGSAICLPFGSKLGVQRIVFASGGGGTNAAVTFARQGYRTACLGVIGKDPAGSAVLDELRQEGVDAKYFQIHDDDITAYSTILVTGNGERTILSYKGEGQHFDAARVSWDKLDAKWLYVNSVGGRIEMLEAAVAWAQRSGARMTTNPGTKILEHGLEKLGPLWQKFDIVGMNHEEAARITGIPYREEDKLFRRMDELIGGIFIMTLGSEGVRVSDGRFIYEAGAPDSEVVERTGAGDSFHSGFLAEFIRSGSVEKAIQAGTANASSVVMQYGSKAGILRTGDAGPSEPVKVSKRALRSPQQ